MAFHLNESGLVVSLTANLGEFLHRRYAFFGILELGSDPECSTSDQLIMFDVDYATGDVAVYDIECEVEGFGAEAESEMNFDKKVDQAGSHVPLDLRLLIHGWSGRHSIQL